MYAFVYAQMLTDTNRVTVYGVSNFELKLFKAIYSENKIKVIKEYGLALIPYAFKVFCLAMSTYSHENFMEICQCIFLLHVI